MKTVNHVMASAKRVFRRIYNPVTFFIVFASAFGVILVFLTPPMQSPDEQAHLLRAYQVSQFGIFAEKIEIDEEVRYGGILPSSLGGAIDVFLGGVAGDPLKSFDYSLIGKYIGQDLKADKTMAIAFEGSAAYSPVVYIPQALGIGVGKLVEASPLVMIWLGRLVNLAVWIVIIAFAIRRLPFAKWAMVILALNPLTLFIAASLSADTLAIALSFLLFSLIMETAVAAKSVSKKRIIALLGICIILALTKPVALLMALMLFVIPIRKFGSVRRFLFLTTCGVLLCAGVALAWNYSNSSAIEIIGQVQRPGEGIDPGQQLSHILHSPLGYVKVLITNYVVNNYSWGDAIITSYFGVFGWLDTYLPLWCILLYMAMLAIALLFQFGRGFFLASYQKLILLAIYGLAFIGSVTALYLNYTPVGSGVIEGVQGRYFMPYAVLLIGLFTARKKILDMSERMLVMIFVGGMLVVLGMTVLKIALRYT